MRFPLAALFFSLTGAIAAEVTESAEQTRLKLGAMASVAATEANDLGRRHAWVVDSNVTVTANGGSTTSGKPGTLTLFTDDADPPRKAFTLDYGTEHPDASLPGLRGDGAICLLQLRLGMGRESAAKVHVVDLARGVETSAFVLPKGHDLQEACFPEPRDGVPPRLVAHEVWWEKKSPDGMGHRLVLIDLATGALKPLVDAEACTGDLRIPEGSDQLWYRDIKGLEEVDLATGKRRLAVAFGGSTPRPRRSSVLTGARSCCSATREIA